MSEAAEPTRGQGAEAPSSFQVLCGGLAAQVHLALGLIPDPIDKQTKVEIGAAKQGIDMLAMLEAKTKGNLDERETKTLGLLLTQLRMIFVERVKELQEGSAEKPAEDAGPEGAATESGEGPTIVTP